MTIWKFENVKMNMKKIAIIVLMAVVCAPADSQTLAEWTQQKKLQIQYLLDQIAANKVFIDDVEKGYEIAKLGLTTIKDIKSGDFDLHHGFFRSLEIINPSVKNYTRVADIITCQLRIVKLVKTVTKELKESGAFNIDELDHCKSVFENLLDKCLENIDELYLVITPGESQPDGYRMTDDERIKRIDQVYADMEEKYSFCRSFSDQCKVLAMQRLNVIYEIKVAKKLNGVQ